MDYNWQKQNITILGLSISGKAAAKYLASCGANCTISERREQNDSDIHQIKELEALGIKVEMGEHKESTLLNSSLVIASPGIPPRAPAFEFLNSKGIKVISEVELAYLEAKAPFVAITGTNGKTTTTKLVSEILKASGLKAPTCGNIGVPPCDLLKQNVDYFVLEVSSFQLERSETFTPKVACLLNYAPDHIDWHETEEAYFHSKAKLFTEVTPEYAIFNATDDKVMGLNDKTGSKVFTFGKESNDKAAYVKDCFIVYKSNGIEEKIISLKEVPVIGEHNYQNIMCAVIVAKVLGISTEIISKTVRDFKSPEHRLEYVATINAQKFYNDSKATNCDSAICALKAFSEKVTYIAGGKDKGTDLAALANLVKEKTNNVILIGQAADRFQFEFKKHGVNNIYREDSLESAIDKSIKLNQGDVLFSPACSSFDMYKNFEERGRVYKQYILQKK